MSGYSPIQASFESRPLETRPSDYPAASMNIAIQHGDTIPFSAAHMQEQENGSASFGLSVFNLMNCILGSGILALPFAMRHSGAVLFGLLLSIMAIFANYSIHLLLLLCQNEGVTSYEALGYIAYGRVGQIFTACTILMQNTGSMTSYLVIVGDLLPDVVSTIVCGQSTGCDEWYTHRIFLMTIATFGFVLPLCCLRTMGVLGYASFLSISVMVAFTSIVIAGMSSENIAPKCHVSPENRCEVDLFTYDNEFFFGVPTMAFSFVCHTGLLPIYADLKNRSKKKMQNIANTSLLASWLLYFTAALFSYMTFFQAMKGDVLENYPSSDKPILILKTCFVGAVMLTLPVINFPARVALTAIFFDRKPFSLVRHFTQPVILLAILLLVAIYVPGIVDVLGIVGATSSVTVVFILPGVFYARLMPGSFGRKKLPLVFAASGLLIGATCIVAIAISLA